MIPWMREKFAERRARWQAGRNKRTSNITENNSTSNNPSNSTITTTTATNNQCSLGEPDVISNQTSRVQANFEYVVSSSSEQFPVTKTIKSSNTKKNTRVSNCSSNDSIEEQSEGVTGEEQISIRVICPNARILLLTCDETKRLIDLKSEILSELSDDPDALQLFSTDVRHLLPRYRLFRGEFSGTELKEFSTLKELHITQHDTLVLVTKRNTTLKLQPVEREVKPPKQIEIDEATRDLSIVSHQLPLVDFNEIFHQTELQYEVRKILISLAQVSAKIIAAGPYAKRLIEMLRQKLISKRDTQKEYVACLVEMGFNQSEVEYGLKLHNNVYAPTLEWLISNQSDETSVSVPQVALHKSQSIMSPSEIVFNDSMLENAEALIEIVRIYSHIDRMPTQDMVSSLVEMGFKEDDVRAALKKTFNNCASACEWLCGVRCESLVELRDGLTPDSPVLKTILEMSEVQLSLSNPKVFLAILPILENENVLRKWEGDETTTVIAHILTKYHEQKHVMGLNQFYGDRS